MRKLLIASAALAAISLGSLATEAVAGGTCYKSVTGKSKYKRDTMRAAYWEAILAWDTAAEKKYDQDFDWYYSGDRTISCKWKTGADILCSATALPCTH